MKGEVIRASPEKAPSAAPVHSNLFAIRLLIYWTMSGFNSIEFILQFFTMMLQPYIFTKLTCKKPYVQIIRGYLFSTIIHILYNMVTVIYILQHYLAFFPPLIASLIIGTFMNCKNVFLQCSC